MGRKYPVAKFLPQALLEWALKSRKPEIVSEITGIRGITGAETKGWFIGCPLTPKLINELPIEVVYDRIVQCTEIAHSLGAKLIGLGAFTSVVGDGGITIAERSKIPVTTGNSYTVATAMEATLKACGMVGINPETATLAVVGASGSIGRTCALGLSPLFQKTLLLGRDQNRLQAVAEECVRAKVAALEDLTEADAIVAVSSASGALIDPKHLKTGSVICDVARPRDVSVRVEKERPDVLVIEGGVVAVPGDVDFHFNFGFPPKTAYACMSETMILALEGRAESFTLGKTVSLQQVETIKQLAEKHGFKLSGFRSFEKTVSEERICQVQLARREKSTVKAP
jgi:predicted amino acid dehydrogenase